MERKNFYDAHRWLMNKFGRRWHRVSLAITLVIAILLLILIPEITEQLIKFPVLTLFSFVFLVVLLFFTIDSLGMTIKEGLVTRKLRNRYKVILSLILLVLPVAVSSPYPSQNYIYIPPEPVALSIEDSIRYTLKDLVDSVVVELMVAQSKHESGNYRNTLSKYNNIFARHYEEIDTFATGPKIRAENCTCFGRFKSIEYATLSQYYYFKRWGYSFNWKTPEEFAIELKKRHYYTDKTYRYSSALRKHLWQK